MNFNVDYSQTSAPTRWSSWHFLHRMYFVKILSSSLVTENRKLGSLHWWMCVLWMCLFLKFPFLFLLVSPDGIDILVFFVPCASLWKWHLEGVPLWFHVKMFYIVRRVYTVLANSTLPINCKWSNLFSPFLLCAWTPKFYMRSAFTRSTKVRLSVSQLLFAPTSSDHEKNLRSQKNVLCPQLCMN